MTNLIVAMSVKTRNYCRNHPWRLLLAAVCFLALLWFIYSREVLYSILAINGIIQSMFVGLVPSKHNEQEFVPDVLAVLKLEHNMLHVKHRQLHVSKVKKVVLDQLDEQQAIIDFPFNVYGKLAMRFPASQLPALQQWLNQHFPEAKIIK